MNKSVLLRAGVLLTIFSAAPAFSGEAVNRVNVDVGGNIAFSDNGDSISAGGDVALPIGEYIGGRAQAGYRLFNGDDVADADGYNIGLGMFLGDKDIGRVGIDYIFEDTKYDSTTFDGLTIESDIRRLMAEAYLGPVTLGYWQADIDQEVNQGFLVDPNDEVSALSVNYYPVDQFRVGLAKYGKDRDDRTELNAEYQFGRVSSLFARYSADDDSDTDTFLVGVTVYFMGGRSLIRNDRHY